MTECYICGIWNKSTNETVLYLCDICKDGYCVECSKDEFNECAKCNIIVCSACIEKSYGPRGRWDNKIVCVRCCINTCVRCLNEIEKFDCCSYCALRMCKSCQYLFNRSFFMCNSCNRSICYNYDNYESPKCADALNLKGSHCCGSCGIDFYFF